MSIQDLLKTPFGPYKEELVLDSKCRATQGNTLMLKHYLMECGGKPIGFDETEDISNARIRQHAVRFRGTLEIQRLSWLTPTGCHLIEDDLRARDLRMHLQKLNKPISTLTLAQIYGPGVMGVGMKVHIIVQCDKLPMGASYYNSPLAPEGLIVRSRVAQEGRPDLTREYEVLNIDIATFELSHNFFRRYQLLNLMERIVEQEPKAIEQRTINYFVKVYIRRFSFTEWHRFNRWIFDTQCDPDVDEHGRTRLPRHPRPIHKSEVISIFASQAEWILEDQKAKPARKRVVDIGVWAEFCVRVKADRKEAARKGIRWGLPGTFKEEKSDDSQCAAASVANEVAVQNVKKRKGKLKVTEHINGSPALESDIDIDGLCDDNFYDDDFSPASTPPADDTDYLSDPAMDPELLALIPRTFYHPPALPGSDFTWRCDVKGCSCVINLLHLTDENVQGLPMSDVEVLKSKQWSSVLENRIRAAFYFMVNRHWEWHMVDWGITFVNPGTTKATLAWIRPNRHRPWPPPEPVRGVQRLMPLDESEEDLVEEVGIPAEPPRRRLLRLRSEA